MELSEVLIEVRKAIRDALSIREGKKVSLRLIRPNFKVFEWLDELSLTETIFSIEERLPQLQQVAESAKEKALEGVHTAQDLARELHRLLDQVRRK